MGFILFIIAILLYLPLTLVNFLAVIFTGWKRHGFFKYKSQYFKQTAIDIDRFGNRNFRTILNLSLRKSHGYKFGDERETISSALGKNQRDKTLSPLGFFICSVLDRLDPGHCKNSINPLNTYK